jgi:hypothetical protein
MVVWVGLLGAATRTRRVDPQRRIICSNSATMGSGLSHLGPGPQGTSTRAIATRADIAEAKLAEVLPKLTLAHLRIKELELQLSAAKVGGRTFLTHVEGMINVAGLVAQAVAETATAAITPVGDSVRSSGDGAHCDASSHSNRDAIVGNSGGGGGNNGGDSDSSIEGGSSSIGGSGGGISGSSGGIGAESYANAAVPAAPITKLGTQVPGRKSTETLRKPKGWSQSSTRVGGVGRCRSFRQRKLYRCDTKAFSVACDYDYSKSTNENYGVPVGKGKAVGPVKNISEFCSICLVFAREICQIALPPLAMGVAAICLLGVWHPETERKLTIFSGFGPKTS